MPAERAERSEVLRYEPWVQHNLIRDEGRLPALRELTQSAPVEKTAALSTELGGRAATGSRATARLLRCERGAGGSIGEVASYQSSGRVMQPALTLVRR